ncbi:macro domain-containing protein [Emticicia sp. 21SJ11W-3]|uniref:type II toxin-antitoxin system antitoxin DNA ADP-ribosyl glycohydrolase DarG n=1 Tax=Emticicia sp. 21SJ11W-3 TaxID=2916755 RepID=UPI00209F6881|nr:macro domain-containing protein [Emticicia sp. 21SJ11W-3]UTA66857.1 macro domain-containing protein [Emticicia sp. 21SJ11W-3]
MIHFKTGNILFSDTEALVNTVNCEGFMGKGIAYQFKLEYPLNNEKYVKACNTGFLTVGKVLSVKEKGKIIINFPTKNKWRENSKYEYIESGLNNLKQEIINLGIDSISIPPLGCGNGGLNWFQVKDLIQDSLNDISDKCEIIIFEPSNNLNFKANSKAAPKLNTSHLLLMNLKNRLAKFNKTRLQKSSFLINYLSNENYFKFEKHHFGPYAHSLEILSKDIKEYQQFYGFDTVKAYEHAKTALISDTTINKERQFLPFVELAVDIVNQILSDRELELLTTILFIIESHNYLSKEEVLKEFNAWSDRKALEFEDEDILDGITKLIKQNLIVEELYSLSKPLFNSIKPINPSEMKKVLS